MGEGGEVGEGGEEGEGGEIAVPYNCHLTLELLR